MARARSKSVDATNRLTPVSESVIAYSEFRRHEGLDAVPTLNISEQYESEDVAFCRDTPPYQHDERESKLIASKVCPPDTERENTGRGPWLVPHTAEFQKRLWYRSSLGMGTKHVVDEWGFSSTSVSRTQSPDAAIEPQDAGNVTDPKK
jgi:hypothetical protein